MNRSPRRRVLAAGGTTVTNTWNAAAGGNSGAVSFTDVGHNGSVASRRRHRVRVPGHRRLHRPLSRARPRDVTRPAPRGRANPFLAHE